jgi:hypothetical protein
LLENIFLFVPLNEGPYADIACLNETYSFVGYMLCFDPVTIIEKFLFVCCQVKERPLHPLPLKAWQARLAGKQFLHGAPFDVALLGEQAMASCSVFVGGKGNPIPTRSDFFTWTKEALNPCACFSIFS